MSGFVYIWFDRKRKMFYVGAHWGTENDGYICSSNRMRNAYNRRKEDFKRRIISRITTNQKDMFDEEQKWLNLIKEVELGKRYYNLCKSSKSHWSINKEKTLLIGQKISLKNKGRKQNFKDPTERGRKISEAKLKKFEEKKRLGIPTIPWNKGKVGVQSHSEEHKKNLSEKFTKLWQDPNWAKRQSTLSGIAQREYWKTHTRRKEIITSESN